MNEQDPVTPSTEEVVEPTPSDVTKEQLATTQDNNSPSAEGEKAKYGISGVELKEGDQVVMQIVPGTEEKEGYSRLVLLSSLSVEEAEALPKGSVKTFPTLN